MIRVVIADDELLARQRIEDLLAKETGIALVAEASSGDDAIAVVRRESPDLLFLDVQMPGRTGLEVAEILGADLPLTIFTTAYEKFALHAFDVAAVDYLVKPFDDERFAQALARARHRLELERGPAVAEVRHEYLDAVTVESRGQMRVVPVATIDYITASGPYAELHVGASTFAVREKMHALEERLDPASFFRIHRSAIVRLDRVDTLRHAAGGDYAVRLKDGTELAVSRARRDALAERLRHMPPSSQTQSKGSRETT